MPEKECAAYGPQLRQRCAELRAAAAKRRLELLRTGQMKELGKSIWKSWGFKFSKVPILVDLFNKIGPFGTFHALIFSAGVCGNGSRNEGREMAWFDIPCCLG